MKMPHNPESLPDDPLRRLEAIMAILRGPEGCPWDREQNHRSLRTNLLEETYEVLEVLDDPGEIDRVRLVEELGDLLLQVVFHAQLGAESGDFDLDEVATCINQKLIYRHPHVFSDTSVSSSADVVRNWERLKRDENHSSAIAGVPRSLPALLHSSSLLSKAERAGFRWRTVDDAMGKVREEWGEFERALDGALHGGDETAEALAREFGDLVLALVTLMNHFQLDPEAALRESAERFEERFKCMESIVAQEGKELQDLEPKELLTRWESARGKRGTQSDTSS